MNIVKKQGIGTWISLGTLLLALIGLIIYGVAIQSGAGGKRVTAVNFSTTFRFRITAI